MRYAEFSESIKAVWTKNKGRNVRKYRCTSGSRKGQIVAKASTCSAPKSPNKSRTLKTSRRKSIQLQKIKSKKTRSYNPASRRLSKLNRRK